MICRVLLKDSNQIEEISEDNDSDQDSEGEYDFSKAVVANDKKGTRTKRKITIYWLLLYDGVCSMRWKTLEWGGCDSFQAL